MSKVTPKLTAAGIGTNFAYLRWITGHISELQGMVAVFEVLSDPNVPLDQKLDQLHQVIDIAKSLLVDFPGFNMSTHAATDQEVDDALKGYKGNPKAIIDIVAWLPQILQMLQMLFDWINKDKQAV